VLTEVSPASVLPARREDVVITTEDGLQLVGELALPATREPVATLVCLHPLPTHGGMMDSHVIRKASFRLPALADLAVLRFNTRGTESPHGRSEGEFAAATTEQHDVEAAVAFARDRGLPELWLLGWSFGTDLALKFGLLPDVRGAVLLSPPLRFTTDAELDAWAKDGRPVVAVVPELDDYLRPDAAAERFARVPQARVVGVADAKHLWVGEKFVRRALDEVVAEVVPARAPLDWRWEA
jgi:alpha/beta superfamily hydrolase